MRDTCASLVSTTTPAISGTGHSRNSNSLRGKMDIVGATHSRGSSRDCRPSIAADTKHKSEPKGTEGRVGIIIKLKGTNVLQTFELTQ